MLSCIFLHVVRSVLSIQNAVGTFSITRVILSCYAILSGVNLFYVYGLFTSSSPS